MDSKDFDPSLIERVSIERVEPNGYNPKLKETPEYRKVVESVRLNGLKQPIFVREVYGNDKYVIVDGEQRWTAANELGYNEIYIYNLGQISEEEAKALTIWFEVQVPFVELELAPLVVELNDLGIELPYSNEEVVEFRDLLDFEIVEEVREPKEKETDVDSNLCQLIIKMASEQFDVVMDAIERVSEDRDISEGSALALLVCGDELNDEE